MKKTLNYSIVAILVLLVSCSGPDALDTGSDDRIQRTEIKTVIASGTPVSTASLGIEGMSCAVMCGGKIKKALESTQGVISAEIEFDAEKKIDVAVVRYHPEEVSDEALIKVVNELRDGVYKVRTVIVEDQVKEERDTEDSGSEKTALVPAKVELPSLMDLLSAVLN